MCFEDISDNKSSMYRNKSVFIFFISFTYLFTHNREHLEGNYSNSEIAYSYDISNLMCESYGHLNAH